MKCGLQHHQQVFRMVDDVHLFILLVGGVRQQIAFHTFVWTWLLCRHHCAGSQVKWIWTKQQLWPDQCNVGWKPSTSIQVGCLCTSVYLLGCWHVATISVSCICGKLLVSWASFTNLVREMHMRKRDLENTMWVEKCQQACWMVTIACSLFPLVGGGVWQQTVFVSLVGLQIQPLKFTGQANLHKAGVVAWSMQCGL